LTEFKELESLVYKREISPPKIGSTYESKNLTFEQKVGSSMSENNLIATLQEIGDMDLYEEK